METTVSEEAAAAHGLLFLSYFSVVVAMTMALVDY